MTSSPQRVIEEVAYSAGLPVSVAKAVVAGYHQKIMHLDGESAKKAILMEVRNLAKQYGARQEIDNDVVAECARLVFEKFATLGIMEIREAYRAYSVGEFEVEGGEMYGGVFNVSNFAKVLAGWKSHRGKVLLQYLNHLEEERMAATEKGKREKAMADFDRCFPKLLEKAKADFTSWQDVPVHWYDTARRLKMMSVTMEEAMPIFDEAKKIVASEQERERGNIATMSAAERKAYKSFDPLQRAKIVARKITVYRKLIIQ